MIDLYSYRTSNGRRVSIMLEETGLDYRAHKVNLRKREHKEIAFLKLNPSGRIPVIIDEDETIVLSQSSAILIYLAEKSGMFLPTEPHAKGKVLEWLLFHATDVTTTTANAFHLTNPEWLGYRDAVQRLNDRVLDWYHYFNQQLSITPYLAGDNYSIADIAMYPSVAGKEIDFFDKYKHILRWKKMLDKRPAVLRGMNVI